MRLRTPSSGRRKILTLSSSTSGYLTRTDLGGLIELRKLFHNLPIVIVSAFADQSVVHKAVVCGAAGFIPKSAGKDTLLSAIRDILAGDLILPPGHMPPDSEANMELAVLTSRLKSLTHQQLHVLQMLCQGLLNKQIAYELDVGETTVKSHVTTILRKLSVCSRTQAVLEVSKLDFSAVLALYGTDDADSAIANTNNKKLACEKSDGVTSQMIATTNPRIGRT